MITLNLKSKIKEAEKKWVVQIIDFDTKQIVKEIECSSEASAGTVDAGVNINLNHDKYYTKVMEK